MTKNKEEQIIEAISNLASVVSKLQDQVLDIMVTQADILERLTKEDLCK